MVAASVADTAVDIAVGTAEDIAEVRRKAVRKAVLEEVPAEDLVAGREAWRTCQFTREYDTSSVNSRTSVRG